jgi:hypothetical protein
MDKSKTPTPPTSEPANPRAVPDPSAIPVDLISTRIAAKLLGGCNISTVYRWVLSGALPGWRRRGRWFVSRADVLAVWQRGKPPEKPDPATRLASGQTSRSRVKSSAWAVAESARRGMD